jgi:hypothetical protein
LDLSKRALKVNGLDESASTDSGEGTIFLSSLPLSLPSFSLFPSSFHSPSWPELIM